MGFNDQVPALRAARTRIEPAKSERRILVLEDNPDSAESLRVLLTLCGYQVAVARTCQEGLAKARKLRPHVVLCDIDLPDGDGYAVASMLRQGSDTGTRLIAVTGYGDTRHRQRALAAGFHQHLVKPVDPRELLEELELPL